MAPTLWAPRADGLRASIWEPGGPLPSGVCDLAELAEVAAGSFIFLDNFTAADETLLDDHVPDVPGAGSWGFGFGSLQVLAGSAVNPAVSTLAGETSPAFDIPFALETTLFTQFGAFSQEDFTTTFELVANFNTITITITSVAGVITAVGGISGYQNLETTALTLDYCTWYTLSCNWAYTSGTITISDGTNEQSATAGAGDPADGINSTVVLQIENVEANGARIASVYVGYVPDA